MIMENGNPMDVGLQPLDRLMQERAWDNHRVVVASSEHLTHKVVQKARKGRRLTRRAQEKVLRALRLLPGGEALSHGDCFTYNGS
jgi:hypothetical protein